MTTLHVPDSPKMLREALCVAQAAVSQVYGSDRLADQRRLERLINECERHRPLGPDGKHGDLHTPTCGCEDVPGPRRPWWRRPFAALADALERAETRRQERVS